MNFNLIEEDWIPVLYRNGQFKRVGIRTALEEAGRIRQIAADNGIGFVLLLCTLWARSRFEIPETEPALHGVALKACQLNVLEEEAIYV